MLWNNRHSYKWLKEFDQNLKAIKCSGLAGYSLMVGPSTTY